MATPLAIQQHFRRLKDPRINRRKRHLLMDIIIIALCAVVCGAKDWQQIETFGKQRRDWLRRFLKLPNGIPSHDTFERVFDRIDPRAFQQGFQSWVAAIAENLKIKHIAIDGKTLRGSGSSKLGPLHLVSAWATEQHLSLGQVATAEKSNEITAIPQLLEMLDLKGAFVTIDAMGCQKEIAAKIVERGGHYVLTVKENQPNLLHDIQDCFRRAFDTNFAGVKHDEFECEEHSHGRDEIRSYTILVNPLGIRNVEEWKDLTVIGMCTRTRHINGVRQPEMDPQYFIGSREAGAKTYAKTLRNHWGIENNLHWQLDVTFAEDANRVSKRNEVENLALLRKLALMMLKRHPSKQSMACKQWNAALNPDFLEEVLLANANSGKV